VIRIEHATLAVAGDILLEDASWHVRPGEHVGLVGRNGTGKTTLLRAIVGELGLDRGTIARRPGMRLGWLPQKAVSGSTRPVWDEVASAMDWFHRLKAELATAEEAVAAGRPGADARFADATEVFRANGGFAVDAEIGSVLHGLGFPPDRWREPCDTFSGGWQMRIALARLLLSRPDVALLDEPTNHLDIEARSWLAAFLARAPWTVVVVSHDRWLLDRAVGRIAEIRSSRLHHYVGNYQAFLVEREARRLDHARRYQRQQEEIARLAGFVERFGAKATKAAQAKSKQKAIDRMVEIERPEGDEDLPRFHLPEPRGSDRVAIALRGAAAGWTEPVFTGCDLELERGMRFAVIGPNGAGKSTLLHALAGRLPLSAGRRLVADRLRIGVFSQDLAAELPAGQTALQWLTDLAPLVPPQRIRTVLGALGLRGDDALREIAGLSGGEKARVALAALAIRPHEALLLDEPTNHLDAESVDALVAALEDYAGALVVVTHDRWLVERLATHVVRVDHGAVAVRAGVRPQDFEREPPPTADAPAEAPPAAADHAARRRRERDRDKLIRRIQALEVEIAADEAALAALDERLFTEFTRAAELAVERKVLVGRIEGKYADWEALEAELADRDGDRGSPRVP
jgi:ATP-binding cassette subfamily F protein 3